MDTWAYRAEHLHTDGATESPPNRRARRDWLLLLNELGLEGWELVVERKTIGEPVPPDRRGSVEYEGTFKRRRTEPPPAA